MNDTALYRVTNGGGGDRDRITASRSWAVSTSVSLRQYDVSGGTKTVTFTSDSYNVRHRGRQVHVCGEGEGGRVVVEERCWFHLCLADIIWLDSWVNKCKVYTI